MGARGRRVRVRGRGKRRAGAQVREERRVGGIE